MGKMDLLGALDLCEKVAENALYPHQRRQGEKIAASPESFKNVGKWEIEKGDGLPAGVTDLYRIGKAKKKAQETQAGTQFPDPLWRHGRSVSARKAAWCNPLMLTMKES